MDVVVHAADADGVISHDLGEVRVVVAVLLRSDGSGKLTDAGVAVGDADARAEGQVVLDGSGFTKVQLADEVCPGGLVEDGKRGLGVAVAQIENGIGAEDVSISTGVCQRIVGLVPHIAREPFRAGYVIVGAVEAEEGGVVLIELLVDANADLVSLG